MERTIEQKLKVYEKKREYNKKWTSDHLEYFREYMRQYRLKKKLEKNKK